MIVITLAVSIFFIWTHITARAEPPSYDSGTNFGVTAIMALIVLILASFVSFSVIVDEKYLRIKFGYGIYKKRFLLTNIESAKSIKNRWFWPKMWIYSNAGFEAVEIKLKNGKTYKIGTNEPKKLVETILSFSK